MSRSHHVPVRSCMGCGARDGRGHMLRIVRDSSGDLRLDSEGRAGGRGGYLHRSASCYRLFSGRKGRVRSFRSVVERAPRLALVESLA